MAGETYLTREGFEKLRKEMDNLQAQKRELSLMIGEAREQGDLRENAGYQYAKEKQSEVMRRIMELEQKAHDNQGADWNQEIFPVIRGVRDLLVRKGVAISS